VTDTLKYLGKYYIFHEVDCDGKPSENMNDDYLEGRYKSQVYRWDNSKLALDLYTTSSRNIIIPELKKAGLVYNYTLKETMSTPTYSPRMN